MTQKSQKLLDAIVQLRAQAALRFGNIDALVNNSIDPDYWQNLNPELAVCKGPPGNTGVAPLDEHAHEQLIQKLSDEGFFQTRPLLAPAMVRRMRMGLERVRTEGWPAVFAFLYDEFWSVFREPLLMRLLAANLGFHYQQLPYLWAHHVGPNSRGWHPHVDGAGIRGELKLSVWLPLTDATLDNGCMYVIRQNNKTSPLAQSFVRRKRYTQADLKTLLQNVRALPVPAGSFLVWGPDLVHWGSPSAETAIPRISLAVEFTCESNIPPGEKLPLLETQLTLPSFAMRLLIISRAVQRYEKFDPKLIRFQELATRIIAQVNGP